MGEKYGISRSEQMTEVTECASYGEAVRMAANGRDIVVYFAHGRWWF